MIRYKYTVITTDNIKYFIITTAKTGAAVSFILQKDNTVSQIILDNKVVYKAP